LDTVYTHRYKLKTNYFCTDINNKVAVFSWFMHFFHEMNTQFWSVIILHVTYRVSIHMATGLTSLTLK